MRTNAEFRMRNLECVLTPSRMLVLYSLFFSVSVSCFAQKNKPYSEDLSKLRPKVEMPLDQKRKDSTIRVRPEITPTKTVNAKVDAVFDSIDKVNLTRKF